MPLVSFHLKHILFKKQNKRLKKKPDSSLSPNSSSQRFLWRSSGWACVLLPRPCCRSPSLIPEIPEPFLALGQMYFLFPLCLPSLAWFLARNQTRQMFTSWYQSLGPSPQLSLHFMICYGSGLSGHGQGPEVRRNKSHLESSG